MRTATPKFIAYTHILWLRKNGTEVELSAAVGEPYQTDAATWACPATLDGLDGRYPDIHGESSMQALSLAIRLIGTQLAHLLDDGEKLVDAQDRSPWDKQSLAHVFGQLTPSGTP